MTPLLLGLALAAPPVPTWTATDREVSEEEAPPEPPDSLPPLPQAATSARTPAVFETAPDPGHGWNDPTALTFDVSGAVGRFYYVMATARGGGLVAHWRQGPIAGEDVTRTFPLDVPVDLATPLQEVGTAHLSLVIVTVDDRDREIGRDRLGTTWIRAEGGHVVGGQSGPPVVLEPRGRE